MESRLIVLVVCAGILAGSYLVYRQLGTEFLPGFD